MIEAEKVALASMLELKSLSDLTIQLSAIDAFAIFAQIQLALRHPKNNGVPSRIGREFAQRIEKHLSQLPTIAKLCEMGWNPEHDL